MLELTRDQFKTAFGCLPGKLFDLTKILTKQHQIEAMRLPNPQLMRVRSEYGTLSADGRQDLIFCIDVGYFIADGRFQATIQKVIIFDNQTEQDCHKAITAATVNQNWNDN
jgi:hypothetical protein